MHTNLFALLRNNVRSTTQQIKLTWWWNSNKTRPSYNLKYDGVRKILSVNCNSFSSICDKEKLGTEITEVELPSHLQPQPVWLENLPFLLKVQSRKDFKVTPKASKVWYTEFDPRLLRIKPFLPTKFDDPIFLQRETIWVYRKLLRESLRFFDLRAREYLIKRIKANYRKHQSSEFEKKIPEIRSQARKFSRLIARANRYDITDILKILGQTYGRTYKLRWELLKPYLPPQSIMTEKYRPWLPLEIPLHPMIVALLNFKDIKLKPPSSTHVEHSPVRLFNFYRNHFKRLLTKVEPPLPEYLIRELELKCDTQYHIQNHELYPLDPRPTPDITIPPKIFDKLHENSFVPAPPSPSRLRRLARCYQKFLLEVPTQYSGPDFFNSKSIIKNDRIKFELSQWAGRRPFPSVSELDKCPVGKGVQFLDWE